MYWRIEDGFEVMMFLLPLSVAGVTDVHHLTWQLFLVKSIIILY